MKNQKQKLIDGYMKMYDLQYPIEEMTTTFYIFKLIEKIKHEFNLTEEQTNKLHHIASEDIQKLYKGYENI